MTGSRIAIAVSHLIGNALLLFLGYYWLGLGESDALHLAFSAAVVLLFFLGAVWLHGTALVLFKPDENTRFGAAARRALRNLAPLAVLCVIVLLIYMALSHFYDSFGHKAFQLGSYTTMKLRRPVEPPKVLSAFHGFIWILRWLVVPFLALPIAAAVADLGWKGFSLSALKRSRKLLFWIQAGVLCLLAIYLPLHLFYWIPQVSSFALETVSVVLRFTLGYFLFTGGLLALEFVTSAGSPRSTQVNTVVSP